MKKEKINKKTNKNIILFLFSIALIFFSFTSVGNEKDKYPVKPLSKKEFKQLSEKETIERVQLLEQRLQDIHNTDISSLSLENKKKLQKEVRDIKKELKSHAVGIYIGGGALVIILLLILLL